MDDSLDFSMSQKEFPAMRTPSRSALRVGNKVEASYRGQGKFYPGVISADGGDGTFDVDYNDGEKEAGVSRDLIRRVGATPTAANDLAVGDAVEARYRGKGKYYPGRIGAVGGDGTFNVDYDDGEKETGVGRDLIRRVGAAPAVASANDLAVGDLVEARYKGKGKFYAGRIGAVGGDGTYNVDYDDGEKESGVARALIRKFGGAPAAAPAAGDLAVGDVVEANYRGKGKFYAGKIGAVGGDGTYSLDYDDGEKESRVRRDLIRKVGSSTAAPAASDLAVGDAVEANYRGKGKFYAGRIRTVGGDGTYAVDYDDGEKGVGVAREMIRKMGAAPAAAAPADDLAVGDAVEARYRGKSKFYAGRIAVVGGDGTYSVDYDDGEKESRVERELIKKTGGAPAAAAPAAPANDLAVGDAVEARYRGKAKFYAGRIRAVGGDGTYSVDYEDGEEEAGVARELIRKQEGGGLAVAAAQLEPVARAASPAAAAPVAVAPLSQVKAKNALFAAAARLKSQDEAVQGSSRVTAENLAAAAVEVEASMDVAAAAGLEAAAAAVRQQGLDAAQRHLAEATADVQSSVRDALRLASGDVDGGLESAAATLANDARADVARAVAPPSDDDEAPPSPPRPRPGGGLPWADGVESRESVHANRSLRSARGRPGGRQDVSRMQRMLAARSVDFGASKPRRSADKRDETFKRLTAEPKKRDRTNLDRFGSLSDAKNCVFQPVTRGDPSGEDKVAAPGRDADDDAGARANNFVQRQDAWGTKVRGEKAFAIGKKAYDQRLDKKRCPCCTAVQSYDEFEEKRMKCVDCGVDYQKANAVTLDHFLARQSEATRRAAARRTALDRAAAKLPRGSKQIYADGRVTTAPLFGAATAGGWDSFQDRMDLDQQRRARHGQREYEDDFNGSSTPGRRAASPLHRTAEPKSNFDDRTAGDVQRRQAKTERWLREDRECKKWFHHQQPGLREPHFHHNDPRTIPDAKW
ncbi:hypothetical protein M885DRAFT_273210 [Pelagophyceae sp. CCMP2097]|nr:hypothetical protein M885DRAFT_273210 [Pelagophyceae sp. CCMP2097]